MDYGKQLDTPEVGSAGPSHDHMLSVSVSPLNGPIPTPSQEEHHHVHSHGGHPQHGGHNVVDHDKGNKTETVPVSASTVVGQMQPVGPNMNTPNNKGQAPNGQPFPMPIFNISGNNQVPFLNGLCNPAMFHLFYSQNGSNPMVMTLASSSGATAETNATATSSMPQNSGPQVLTLVPASMSNGQMPSGANGSMPVMTSPMKRLSKNGNPSSNKERIFPCMHPGCNCSFSTRFSLKRHQKKHSGDRPYICNHLASLDGSGKQCGRRFAEMSTLKRHTRTHTGERPYKCDFPGCDKSFADRTNVRRHRQTHEQSKRFACPGDNCNRTFARKGFLSKHLESEHQTMGGSGMANLAAAVSATSGEHDEDDETSDDTDSRVGSPKNGPQQVMQQMAGIQLPIIPPPGTA